MRTYIVTITVSFGSFDLEVQAEDENEAFDIACKEASAEIADYARLDDIHEIDLI